MYFFPSKACLFQPPFHQIEKKRALRIYRMNRISFFLGQTPGVFHNFYPQSLDRVLQFLRRSNLGLLYPAAMSFLASLNFTGSILHAFGSEGAKHRVVLKFSLELKWVVEIGRPMDILPRNRHSWLSFDQIGKEKKCYKKHCNIQSFKTEPFKIRRSSLSQLSSRGLLS